MAEEGIEHMDNILYCAAGFPELHIATDFTYENHFVYQTPEGNNALHIAAQHGNAEFINEALAQLSPEHHYSLVCQQNSKGKTPMHLASEFGHKEAVNALLRAHFHEGNVADPFSDQRRPCWSEKDAKGDTPLHKALRNRHDDIAILLLDLDIQLVSVCNESGESPVYLAVEGSCNRALQIILGVNQGILQQSIGFSGPFNQTVFHSAMRRNGDIIDKLIEMRGDLLKQKDWKGKTVLHYAVEENRPKIVETLLRANASLGYLQDNDGLTPLLIASSKLDFEMVQTLTRFSPQSAEIRDNQGKTFLHYYASLDNWKFRDYDNKIIKGLINEVDNDGNTPLHTALLNSKYEAAFELLVVNGCNWRLKNSDGYSPLELYKSNHKIAHKPPVYFRLEELENGRELRTRKKRRDWSLLWRTPLEGMEEKEVGALMDKIGVAAALLLQVSFAATFSIPGGYDQQTGYPIFREKIYFSLFMISQSITFWSTVCILISYTFGQGNLFNKRSLARLMIRMAQFAIIAIIVAYYSGLGMLTTSNSFLINIMFMVIVTILYMGQIVNWGND